MAKISDFNGITEDLNRQIRYNQKHGGSPLKKFMKRPENFRNGEGSGLMHTFNGPLPLDKCPQCGKIKFEYQDVCWECNSKKNVQSK